MHDALRGVWAGAKALVLPLFFAISLLTGGDTTDPFMADAVIDPPFTSLTYGVQAFLWWDPTTAAIRLDQIRTMVFSHVKQTFSWKDVQPLRDEWHFEESDRIVDEVQRRGLRLVARLSDTPGWALPAELYSDDFLDSPPADFADFATYCGTIASRYVGRIDAYQIWNEPNLSREWGGRPPDAAGYVGLLKACSDAIRAADPDAIIISAGLAPTGTYDAAAIPDDLYLQRLYDAGFQPYADVVGVHAPGYSNPERSPDEAVRRGSQRFFTFRRVEDLRRIMVANGDARRQMAILETGWTRDTVDPAYSWFAVNEKAQARHLVVAYRYAAEHWRPWVGLMTAIYIADPRWTPKDEEYHWSIISPEGWQLESYPALANMPKYCGDRTLPQRAAGSPEALGIAPIQFCVP
jgi:polysaccharide biosynthesis protein PslG